MLKFKCAGSDCEDNCCHDWVVYIDKQTFKYYQKCRNKTLAKELSAHFKRNKTALNDQSYGVLTLTDDHRCPFLTEERLCKLQLTLGFQGLSQTCATYPRILNGIEGQFEQALTLSCPPAAKMVLSDPEPMRFTRIETAIPGGTPLSKLIKPVNRQMSLLTLRRFVTAILQARRYTMHERMLLLGIFCDNLQDLIREEAYQNVDLLIARFQDILRSPEKTEIHVKAPREDPRALQLRVLSALIGRRLEQGITFKPFIEFYTDFLKGLEYEPDMSAGDLADNYQRAADRWHKPFMEKHPQIMENYVVNYCFKNAFPCETGTISFEDFVKLSIHYGLIQMHLTGIAGYYKERFSLEHATRFISAHARVIEHNAGYIQWVCDWFVKNKVDDLPSMAVLLRA
jgi:lysine-N-methylase